MAARGVIVAVAGPVETRVVEAVGARPSLSIARRCADLAEAVAAAAAGVGAVAIVSDQPHLTRSAVAQIEGHGVVVVGLARSEDEADHLRAIGVRATVAAASDQAALGAALEEALESAMDAVSSPAQAALPGPVDEPRREGTLIAVWGPTGAPGRTTIAANLAAELAALGHGTLLVDADTYGGAVAQACGMADEAPGLAAAARTAQHGVLDASRLARHALALAPRLSVLTGITRPERWTELPAAALDEVWSAARALADVTVVDCGFGLDRDEDLAYDTAAPQRNGATLGVLTAATDVIAVGTAEPLGIQRLVHGLDRLRDVTALEPVVVVNRVRAEVVGPRPEEAVADALLRFARVPRVWPVPWDPRACDAAVLAGTLLVEQAPRSRARRAIAALAASVAPMPSTSDPVDSPRRPRSVAAAVGH